MQYSFSKTSLFLSKSNCLILLYNSIDELKKTLLSSPLQTFSDYLINATAIHDSKQSITQHHFIHLETPTTIFFVNPGAKNKLNAIRNSMGALVRLLRDTSFTQLSIECTFPLTELITKQCIEGLILGNYNFSTFKSEKPAPLSIKTCTFHSKKSFTKNLFTAANHLALAQNHARDLANTPANFLTPKHVIEHAKTIFKQTAVDVNVITKKQAEEKKMGAFLAVAQGSSCE